MALIVLFVLLNSLVAFSSADVAESLAVYQKNTDGVFTALQNHLNAQRQAYSQAFSKLSEDITRSCDVRARDAQDHAQYECSQQLNDLNRQLLDVTNRTNSEKARLQIELQTQTLSADKRMAETIKNHQQELARVRSEMAASNAQTLNNLRRELEGQISVAQGEVLRIQSEHEAALRNIQAELEQTRKDGEIRYRNVQLGIGQQNRKFQEIF
ncbi:uncharacterized protein LOC119076590 [Bradysia coprophila]|uniref:uncharacterized protein LOC119076590 n=1 Tax=Bradysia coprophila TaxID=38358 RepID=UPI00187D8F34|nr:uncharacterized protein LOC119076590 [Bradysia coprophila]